MLSNGVIVADRSDQVSLVADSGVQLSAALSAGTKALIQPKDAERLLC